MMLKMDLDNFQTTEYFWLQNHSHLFLSNFEKNHLDCCLINCCMILGHLMWLMHGCIGQKIPDGSISTKMMEDGSC